MLALLGARDAPPRSWRVWLLVLGLVGAALLYGDGVTTPAISVLSAVKGLKLDAPQLELLVLPVTLAILVALFLVQRRGTEFIGSIFGPVMLAWFLLLAVLGLAEIARAPGVLAALNPLYAVDYLLHAGPVVALAVLGAGFLAVTGGEAMYADMDHFGRRTIRLGWFAVALPGLVLNYFGQGALLLSEPEAVENPFYHLAPDWAHYPLVAFATAGGTCARSRPCRAGRTRRPCARQSGCPNSPFSSVDAPVDARTICRVARAQLGADFCPAFSAAIQRRGPVWEFADRLQI